MEESNETFRVVLFWLLFVRIHRVELISLSKTTRKAHSALCSGASEIVFAQARNLSTTKKTLHKCE